MAILPPPDQSFRTRTNARPCIAFGHHPIDHDDDGCHHLGPFTSCPCPWSGVG